MSSYNKQVPDLLDLTSDQKGALKQILAWWQERNQPTITLGGFAGCGKTSLLAILRLLLKKLNPNIKVAFCAYTGKASRVLETTLRLHQARIEPDSVSTIHSLIYAPVTNSAGAISGWKRKQTLIADLIVVDEASMVDRDIWEDLVSFGVPILAVGDHGQLPPIRPGFSLMARPDILLTTIHRQAQDNPIIHLSLLARESGSIPIGNYGFGVRKIDRFDTNAQSEIDDVLNQSTRTMPLLLVGYNTSRIRLNKHMRSIAGYTDSIPQAGDRIICLKNNWEKGIYNGMTGVVKRCRVNTEKPDIAKRFDGIYSLEADMEDGSLAYEGQVAAGQFLRAQSYTSEVRKQDEIDLFDFGYALTVHKAQGSQAPSVVLFEERNQHMSDDDWKRWLYTGITRAEERILLIGT